MNTIRWEATSYKTQTGIWHELRNTENENERNPIGNKLRKRKRAETKRKRIGRVRVVNYWCSDMDQQGATAERCTKKGLMESKIGSKFHEP